MNELINYGIEPVNVCTSISTDYMLARASAVGDRCELVFGYVPRNSQQIGLSANHDLSTKKALNKNNQPIRIYVVNSKEGLEKINKANISKNHCTKEKARAYHFHKNIGRYIKFHFFTSPC